MSTGSERRHAAAAVAPPVCGSGSIKGRNSGEPVAGSRGGGAAAQTAERVPAGSGRTESEYTASAGGV